MGGAIENYGTLSISAAVFLNNHGWLGGAIYNRKSGVINLNNVTFKGNSVSYQSGGALLNSGTITLKNVYFLDNHTPSYGGAIYNIAESKILSIDGAVFSGNAANLQGGAIYNHAGTIKLDGAVYFLTETDSIFNRGNIIINPNVLFKFLSSLFP